MIFRPELAEAVCDRRKTVTRRPFSPNPRSPWSALGCKLKVGKDYAVQPGRGLPAVCRVVVESVQYEPVGFIGDADARREGFEDAWGFIETWRALYGGRWDPDKMVWRVEFRLLHVESGEG